MISFAYYGGKNKWVKTLLPFLPTCNHYVEPFCGSAAVLLNRAPSPIETISDIYGDLINFFTILRERPAELVHALNLTPYSRQEFENAWVTTDNPLESARRFYVRTQMDMAKAGNKVNKTWAVVKHYKDGSHSYPPDNFYRKISGMLKIAQRLKCCQIENRPASVIIPKYDTPDTLFYCDPPYLHETRSSNKDYRHELDIDGHFQLAEILNAISGKAAVSGYDHPLMDEMYPKTRWEKIKFKSAKPSMSRGSGLVRQECLWVNYKVNLQKTLF